MNREDWQVIQRFESADYVASTYLRWHGRILNSARKQEITALFTHGKEYFKAGEAASEIVSPLLIYYGCASLIKGLTLLRSRTKTYAALKPAHGFIPCQWTSHLTSGNLLDLEVTMAAGTFADFIYEGGNRQSVNILHKSEYGIGLTTRTIDFGVPLIIKEQRTITLKQIVGRVRGLGSDFRIATGHDDFTAAVIVMYEKPELKIYLVFSHGSDPVTQLNRFRLPSNVTCSVEPNPLFPRIPMPCFKIPSLEIEDADQFIPLSETLAEPGKLGLVSQPLDNGDRLSDLCLLYICSYFLGMICRYQPNVWLGLLRSTKGDIERSTILSTAAKVQNDFPRHVAEHLLQHLS